MENKPITLSKKEIKFLSWNKHLTPVVRFGKALIVRDEIKDEWGNPIHYVLASDGGIWFTVVNTNAFFATL
jgi:hypothetical protein